MLLIVGCSSARSNGARELTPPSHGNGLSGLTSVGAGLDAKISGYSEIPRQGITCPNCHGRPSGDTSWFVLMRRRMIQTCAPTGNGERPEKQNFFQLGDNGNWQDGSGVSAQSATTACTTKKDSTFITLSRSLRAGRTQSQTSR